MSKQPEHKKENSDETVDSGVSMGFPSMSSDKERDPPPHDPEDSGFEATKRIFPITPDDPIVAVWESSLCKKIIGLIEPTPGWCAVDVIRSGYGLSAEENPVTILVAVTQDASIPEWQRLVRKMKDCCINEQCPHVIVQVQEGKTFRSAGVCIARPYSQNPPIGSSISAVGQDITGTLGGFLELRKEGYQPMIVGITCHHVFASRFLGRSCTDGLFPDSDNTVDVCQPSTADYQQSELEATGTLKRAETRLKDLKTRAEEGLADGAELRSLPSKENQIAAQKAMLSETQAFNTHLGSVFASSGFRRKEPAGEGCCLDWALVRVDKTRMGNNNFPEGTFPRFQQPTPPCITNTTVMCIGELAVKWGRTTGHTAASFSCIKSHVKLPSSGGTSTEWCFVGKDGRDFSHKGDSGSLVLSEFGELAGIVVGGSLYGPGGFVLTYVTPITEVFSDISQRLGCSVHLPEAGIS